LEEICQIQQKPQEEIIQFINKLEEITQKLLTLKLLTNSSKMKLKKSLLK
jgi:predicted nucleic acid-binding OB-fold protein